MSIVFSVLAALFSVATYVSTNISEKKKLTIEAYGDLQGHLYHLYEYQEDEIEDFVTDRNSEEYKVISSCIARIEIFAIGVKEGTYDFRVMYSMAHGYLDGAIRRRIECILEMKTGVRGEDFYNHTKWLFKKMDNESARQNKR